MKIMNKWLMVALITVLSCQSDVFAKSIVSKAGKVAAEQVAMDENAIQTEADKVKQAASNAQTIITAAKLAINDANDKKNNGEISAVEMAKIVGENNYKIEQAKEQLKSVVTQAEDTVKALEQEENYWNRFTAGVYGFGERVLAPFKYGYGYTEQEKGIARAIIAESIKQMEEVTLKYENNMKLSKLSEDDKRQLKNKYDTMMQEFKKQVEEQQAIVGGNFDWGKIAFWSSVGLATAVIAGLSYKYLGAKLEEPTLKLEEPMLAEPTLKLEESILKSESQFGLPLYEGGLKVYQAPEGEKSYIEKLQEAGETPEQYRGRIQAAQEIWGRPAEAAVEAREALKERKTPEEQQRELQEAGEQLKAYGTSVVEAGKTAAKRIFGAEPGERAKMETGGAMISPESLESIGRRVGGAEQYHAPEEKPFGGVTTYESAEGESLAEKGLKRLAGTEQVIAPEEKPFGGVTTYKGAKGKSLAEKGLERLAGTEQVIEPEEKPFGGVTTYEGAEGA